ncbi:MAG: NAD-dependent epimerase/dehydratase family protein [Solirubrobacteraceae bacterium]
MEAENAHERARTYLVTGGAGFIGSHLTDALVARGDSVIVLDDLSAGSLRNLDGALSTGRVEVVRGEVQDAALVESCMSRVDACVHLAAALGVQNIVDNPLGTLLANVRGTDVVMAAAARHERKLLFASSSEVYGKGGGEALTESDDCTIGAPSRSRWSYAIAKQFGESLAHAYVQCERADMAAVRFFNVIGPRQSPAYGMVLPRFVEQALASEPLTIYGDGSQTRCFTSVHDAVAAVVGLLDCTTAAGATYNIGSAQPVRIDDLAARVIARSRSRSQIAYVPYERAYGRGYEELGQRVPDTTALRERTGWSARRTLDEMIDEVLAARLPAPPVRRHARTRRRAPLTPTIKR